MNTDTTINGLLTVKPTTRIAEGDVISLSWKETAGRSGKPYIKIKRETAEFGGVDCRIISAEKTTYVDAHGNVSYNLEFTPDRNGQAPQRQNAPSGPANAPVARPNVLTPAEHVGRAAALWLLCYDEVTAVIQPRCSDMTPDLKQAAIASLFIEASRAGCVSQCEAHVPYRTQPQPDDDEVPF